MLEIMAMICAGLYIVTNVLYLVFIVYMLIEKIKKKKGVLK